MATYNTYNNNKDQNKDNGVTTFSYSMMNPESKIDATRLGFKFWKTFLCVNIAPAEESNGEVKYNPDNGVSVFISHTSARILAEELTKFLSDPVTYNGVGVVLNTGVITISNGVEYGKNAPVLTIRKVDENGNVSTSFAYEFKTNYHYSVRGYTGGSEFSKEYRDYEKIEIDEFISLLNEYCAASTNAVAHTVASQLKYHVNRLDTKADSILNALGVSTPSNNGNGGQRRYNNTSFFNNSNGSSGNNYSSNGGGVVYESASMDELDD